MKKEFKIFVEKVPALKSTKKVVLTLIYILGLIGITILFFYIFNRFSWYMPILTQFIMALVATLTGALHLQRERAMKYRKKYEDLAYQKYFYRYIIPCLVSWYAIFFHPLFVTGIKIFPFWVALIIGIIFIIMFLLVSLHIERAGFKVMTHGMDIYTLFPEETTIVRGEIYSYIRHPLYLSLTFGCFGLAFIANNYTAFICAIIQLIPCIIVGKTEDKELIKRDGKNHIDYINSSALIFPFKRMLGFFKLLFFFK